MSRGRMLSPAQIADRWGCAPKTVVRRIQDGELVGTQFPFGYRAYETDVEKYEQEHAVGTAAEQKK